MINGLQSFRTHFASYNEHFVIIGGTACHMILSNIGQEFRTTKDIDMVIMLEKVDKAFCQHFWQYVIAGKYEVRERENESRCLYRFQKPSEAGYPFQLELFIKSPNSELDNLDQHTTPIPIDKRGYSLSAIMLDEEYYKIIQEGSVIIDELPVLKIEYIILLKAKAWCEMTDRNESSKHIKKHMRDLIRMTTILDHTHTIQLPALAAHHLHRIMHDETFINYDVRNLLGRKGKMEDVMQILQNTFNITD